MSNTIKTLQARKVKSTIKGLFQQTLRKALLEAELEELLGYSRYQRSDTENYRNGYTLMFVYGGYGAGEEMEQAY